VAVVTGAGTIGIMVALAALAGGCAKVVVSDISAPKLEIAGRHDGIVPVNVRERSLAEAVRAETGDWGADIVFEANGAAEVFDDILSPVRPGDTIVLVGLPPGRVPFDVNGVMAASCRTTDQVRALAGCDRLIVSAALLDILAAEDAALDRRLDPDAAQQHDRVRVDEVASRGSRTTRWPPGN
jgi:D-xylulose reductase